MNIKIIPQPQLIPELKLQTANPSQKSPPLYLKKGRTSEVSPSLNFEKSDLYQYA